MTGGGGASSGAGRGAWEATNTVFRIAKVGLSLASAIMTMTATSKQCMSPDSGSGVGSLAGSKVSYSDYGSFQYAALASLVSAVLQGVAIWLEVIGKERWFKAVELIDKVVQALTSTSAALLLAVDDITSCGPPRSRGGAARRQQPRSFDAKLGLASITSLSAVVLGAANDVVKKVKELPSVPQSQSPPPMPRRPSLPPLPPLRRPPPSPPPPSSSTPVLPSPPQSPSPPPSPPSSPPSSSSSTPPQPPQQSPHTPIPKYSPLPQPPSGHQQQPPQPCTCGCDGGCDETESQPSSQFILIIMMLIIALLFTRLCSRCSA